MSRQLKASPFYLCVLASLFAFGGAHAQGRRGGDAPAVITQRIDERNRVTLQGSTRHEVDSDSDRGDVDDALPMQHMLLQLRRSPDQERKLQQFIDDIHKEGSANFHRWIGAQEFGQRFGLATQDLDTITGWLEAHGFQINVVYSSGMVIDFSGTARQVRLAFHTPIHHFNFRGEQHIGNVNDPQIPAALAPAIVGVVSLNDVKPVALHKMRKFRGKYTFDSSGPTYAIVPSDLATIYNLNPLFRAGYAGQGQTIVLIEDTNVYSAADWTKFRSTFGLSGYSSASFATIHPAPSSGPNNCSNPGVIPPNDAEAILDAEWASASAPGATLKMASCADTTTTFGGLIALENLINSSSQPPAIMSISYGQCETQNGASANAAYYTAYQQAVAEGVSVFVAAGDSGAAGCDNSASQAVNGIGANAFASTPYNVAVGGTDFSDTYSGTNNLYWNTTNNSTFGSALSYIPEIPWNNSCAGQLISNYEGYTTPYGPSGFCSSDIGAFLQTTVAGGGSPSGCATGNPSIAGVVSGSCAGWPKPSWQSILGNPNDGVRDTPDVSLFAADGLWGHYYVFCWSDTANGGAACTGAPSGWSGAGGTSFASPIMAGVQALINQKSGSRQGNPNPEYYHLAATEYSSNGSSCNSSNGSGIGSACIFNDITQGDMDVNCTGPNCYQGVLSTSNQAYNPAYGTGVGWDFATGIGSINAANLVNSWPNTTPGFTLSGPPTLTLTEGTSVTTTITINEQNGFGGSVGLSVSGLPAGVTASFSPNPATTSSVLTLTATSAAATGTVTLTINGTSGSLTNSTTITLAVTVVGNFTLSASPNSVSVIQGSSGTSKVTVTPQSGFTSGVSLAASGLPTGVTASFSPNPVTGSSTMTLMATSTATTGTATVTVTGTVGGLIHTATVSVTITAGPNFTLSASPSSLGIPQGGSGIAGITVAPQNGFSSKVTLSVSGLPSGVTALFSPNPTPGSSTLTLMASSVATTGPATVTVTGTCGTLANSTTVALTVFAATDFSLGWFDSDIGAVGVAGSAAFSNGTFTVKGAGQQIWGNADSFNFAYQTLSGDGSIVARVVGVQGNASTEAGVMIRETLTSGSDMGYVAYSGSTDIYWISRPTVGANNSSANTNAVTLPYWVKLVRSGNTFTSYAAADGVSWVQVGSSQTISMAPSVYIGLAVSSNNTSSLATATFDNVSISTPGTPGPVISGVSATTGSVGGSVVISGSGFGATQGNSAVILNGTTATSSSWSDSSISVTIPSGATSGPLAVLVAPSMNASNPVAFTVTSQPLPSGWLNQDVGQVGVAGSATYLNGTFTVKGSGQYIWYSSDGFQFVYQPLSGDGSIVARVVSVQGGSSVEAGVMIRETLTAGSDMAYTAYSGSTDIYWIYRPTVGANVSFANTSAVTLPYWVKLVRSGNTFTSYAAADGANWVQVGATQTINMGQNAYIGMALSSDVNTSLANATFDNVSVSTPGTPAPLISAVSTTTGSVGTAVVISGFGFGATQGNSAVILNGTAVPTTSWSDSSIGITIPSSAPSGPLAVLVAPSMNASNPVSFTVN
jgi:subtilase family serine protease